MTKAAPQRVRVAKLQDSQLDAVVAIDAACTQMMHRSGVSAAEQPPRGVPGIGEAHEAARHPRRRRGRRRRRLRRLAGRVPGVAYLEDSR